jgi:hypothetical protein
VLKNNCSCLARREFVTTAVAAGGAMLLGPAWLKDAADADGLTSFWLLGARGLRSWPPPRRG